MWRGEEDTVVPTEGFYVALYGVEFSCQMNATSIATKLCEGTYVVPDCDANNVTSKATCDTSGVHKLTRHVKLAPSVLTNCLVRLLASIVSALTVTTPTIYHSQSGVKAVRLRRPVLLLPLCMRMQWLVVSLLLLFQPSPQ